jgi:predicted phosphodiesterase
MPRGGDEITEMARRLIAEHPDHPCRGLARMLVKEANGAITLEQARRRIARLLGVNGKQHRRECANTGREPRQAGVEYRMPPSMAEPWEPFVLKVVGRVGILSDVHVPYHSEVAVTAAVDYLREQKLSALLLNGDIADFYSISRFIKDPRKRDFSGELEAVRSFVGWIRDQFRDIPIVFKSGNHEERWQHYIWQHAPELSREKFLCLQQWLHLDRHDITLVEDQRPVMLGKLPVLHGHELPRGIAAPVNPARGAFMRTLSTVLVGHSHRTSAHAESNMWHDEIFCWSTGCLCDLTPEYSRINRFNHGFAVVDVHEGGEFDVENLRVTAKGTVRSS